MEGAGAGVLGKDDGAPARRFRRTRHRRSWVASASISSTLIPSRYPSSIPGRQRRRRRRRRRSRPPRSTNSPCRTDSWPWPTIGKVGRRGRPPAPTASPKALTTPPADGQPVPLSRRRGGHAHDRVGGGRPGLATRGTRRRRRRRSRRPTPPASSPDPTASPPSPRSAGSAAPTPSTRRTPRRRTRRSRRPTPPTSSPDPTASPPSPRSAGSTAPPRRPEEPASPKAKIPPSDATSQ